MALKSRWLIFIFLIFVLAVNAAMAQESGDPGGIQAVMTFTVNSTNDVNDGTCNASHCSLREAINASNANPDKDTIAFNIPGTAPFTIQPSTALPLILNPVIIDGTTQPGFSGIPLVVLNGSNYTATTGQEITAVGINILSGGTTVRGLVLNGWKYGGVGMPTGNGNTIEGNYIGTNAAGTAAVPNLYGVIVVNSANNVIGGTTAAARNIISGNDDDGVNIYGQPATNNIVIGNYIGTDVTGTVALGNGDDGVKIQDATNNRVGGTTASERNLIAHSLRNGVILKGATTSNNVVQGNTIGTDVSGTLDLGNRMHGIFIEDAPNNTIGGTAAGAGNLIAYNDLTGINVTTASGNRLSSNSIFANDGMGIDLGGDGVTVNDANDADTGANNLQNFPILTGATVSGNTINIAGLVNSSASTTFRLEFFAGQNCDKSGNGEGRTYLGFVSATTDGSGQTNFNASLDYDTAYGSHISATATHTNNDTSEFSPCIMISSSSPIGCPAEQSVSVNFKQWVIFGVVKLEINNTGAKYVELDSFGIRWIQRAPGVLTLDQVTVGGAGPSDVAGKIIWQSGSPAQDSTPPTIASSNPAESEGNWLDEYVFPPNSVTPIYLDFGGTTTTLPAAFGATPSDLNGTWFDLKCLDHNRPPRADARGVDENGATMAENQPVVRMTDGAGTLVNVTLDGQFSTDPDGTIVRYLWTINGVTYADGNDAESRKPTLQLGPGIYNVVLTVYDNGGATDEDEISVTINVPNPPSYTVTTIDDTDDGVCDSQCSLREAITLSNSANGKQIIRFNIPGAAPYTIQPASVLPTITDPVIIDGWSEPDFAGTPIIEIDGTVVGINDSVLHISAGNSTIRGLVINRYHGTAIRIDKNGAIPTSGNTIIEGNYLGTNLLGTAALAFNTSVSIIIEETANNRIGTDGDGSNDLAERNIIHAGPGIVISGDGADNNIVAGNFIGLASDGVTALASVVGGGVAIQNEATNNRIGTNADGLVDASERNIISGAQQGIYILANGNFISGNFIGTDSSGASPVGNSEGGIIVAGDNNIIGGTTAGSGNLIFYNERPGVRIDSGTQNSILGNRIGSNGELGIAHNGNTTPHPNDPGDGDTGPNNRQNFPVLTSASANSSAITINGTLNSAANTAYRIEFFANDDCDPSGYGEGQIFIGATNVTTNGSGNANFDTQFAFTAASDQQLTTTATDPDGNTSEFSQCSPIIIQSGANEAPERNAFPTTAVTLTWNRITWATGYQIQIATDAQFNNIEDEIELPAVQLSYDWTAPNVGKYYWRIRAKGSNNVWRAWSSRDNFVVLP